MTIFSSARVKKARMLRALICGARNRRTHVAAAVVLCAALAGCTLFPHPSALIPSATPLPLPDKANMPDRLPIGQNAVYPSLNVPLTLPEDTVMEYPPIYAWMYGAGDDRHDALSELARQAAEALFGTYTEA